METLETEKKLKLRENYLFGVDGPPKLIKGPYKSLNWVEGYEIVTGKYILLRTYIKYFIKLS